MERTNLISNQLKKTSTFWGAFFLIIFIICGCAAQKSQIRVSQYRFNLADETYRIRSISAKDKSESYNEVIGEKFIAADYDQDGVIDTIVLGEVSLNQAQKIYDYGINGVTKENKLRILNPGIDRYMHEKNDFQLEIRSFRPMNAQPFNEFKITDNRPIVRPEVIILVDQNADGILDEVLKGSVALEKYQPQYDEMIASGLEKGDLIKVNGMILVKEK
ncbi:MAG TPA: hypothetical protein VGD14_09195 [bacterium]